MRKLEGVTRITGHSIGIGRGDMNDMDHKVERVDRGYRSLHW